MDHGQLFFLYIALLKISDALTVLGVWLTLWYVRFGGSLLPTPKGIPNFADYSSVSIPLVIVYSTMFHVVGTYRRDRIHFGFRSTKKLVEGSTLGTLVFISLCYFLGQTDFSRLYLILFPFLASVALIAQRGIWQVGWNYVERNIARPRSLLIVGHGPHLNHYLKTLSDFSPYPIRWVGRLGPRSMQYDISIPYLGDEERLTSTLRANKVDWIIVAYPSEEGSRYAGLLEQLSNEPYGVKILPDFGKYSTFTYAAITECGIPTLLFNEAPMSNSDRFVKRVVDIVGSGLFLILAAPLYALIALAVKVTTRGSVIYSQERIGADGKKFQCFKFRSMPPDAESQTGAVWASENDPRVTPLGKLLRRSSLDEIPQFYNVLRGDMSLVGPRPERPVFVEQFRDEIPKYMLRHRMKSGITGWAQVNGWRGNTSIEERIKHDLHYISNWSFRFDIKILSLTLVRGFVHKNAY